MKKTDWQCRGLCLFLAAMLLLIFCVAVHDCHNPAMEDHCPVCLVLAAWKLALPALFFTTLLTLTAWGCLHTGHTEAEETAGKTTLVALKVKLSD